MTVTQDEQLPPKRIISADEFDKIVTGQLKGKENYKYFYSDRYHENGIVFYNCQITDIAYLNNNDSISIVLDKCETQDIAIYNSSVQNLLIFHSKIGRIDVQTSKFKRIQISQRSVVDDIYFMDKCELSNFFINEFSQTGIIQLSNSSCQIFRCEKNAELSGIEIYGGKFSQFYVNNSSRIGTLSVEDLEMNTLTISDSQISGITKIYGTKIPNMSIRNSILDECIFNSLDSDNIEFISSQTAAIKILYSKCNTISFTNGVIAAIYITSSQVEKITAQKNIYIKNFELENIQKGSKYLSLEGCTIHDLSLRIDIPYEITIKKYEDFYNREAIFPVIVFFNLDSTIFPKGAYLHISQVSIHELSFDSFINEGTIVLNGVKPIESYPEIDSSDKTLSKKEDGRYIFKTVKKDNKSSAIDIVDSDLGNTQFIGCDLAAFSDFEFKNSKILGVFIAGSTLPTRETIIEDKHEFQQRRLALSQFKKIFESQGDTVMASDYHSQEMEIYKKQISFKEKPGTWLILWLSSITSDFGQNIWKPLASLLTVHYWLYMLILGVNAIEIKKCQEIIYYYFYLANPLHQYIFCEDWTIIIDILMRIWSSYMIYNFIRASRRFIK